MQLAPWLTVQIAAIHVCNETCVTDNRDYKFPCLPFAVCMLEEEINSRQWLHIWWDSGSQSHRHRQPDGRKCSGDSVTTACVPRSNTLSTTGLCVHIGTHLLEFAVGFGPGGRTHSTRQSGRNDGIRLWNPLRYRDQIGVWSMNMKALEFNLVATRGLADAPLGLHAIMFLAISTPPCLAAHLVTITFQEFWTQRELYRTI